MLKLTCVDLVPSNIIIFPDVYFPWGFSGCVKPQLHHWIFEVFFSLFLRKLSSNRAQKAVEGRLVFAVFISFAGSTWWPFRERDKLVWSPKENKIKAELTTPVSPAIICHHALVNNIKRKILGCDVDRDIIYLYWHRVASAAWKHSKMNQACCLTLPQPGSSQGLYN